MGFNFNGATPKRIIYNNQEVKVLKYNNTEVWVKSSVPSEYQEVEYIESTGTQYIDTGMKGTENTKVDIEFQITGIKFLPFGARSGATSNCFAIWSLNANVGSSLRVGFDGTNGYTGGPTTTDKYHIIHSKDGTYVNNELVWTIQTISTFTTPQNLIVFGYYSSSTNRGLSEMKLYSLKLWENNTLVRNFIPCYKKSNNEIGLYDTINDVFYTNNGTGTFLKGDDIIKLPSAYQRVEYIESTGTQYIDTNYTPNQNTKAYTKFNSNTLQSGLYSSSNKFTAYINSNGNWRFGSTTVRINPSIGVLYTSVQDKTGVIINETDVYNYDDTVTDFTSTATLRLMFNSTGFNGKIYEFKLYDNDILVRNFIPCYRKSDNVAGMYDIVSGKFFTNDGTGSFAVGNNI